MKSLLLFATVVVLAFSTFAFSQKTPGGGGGNSGGGIGNSGNNQPSFSTNPGWTSNQGADVRVRVAWPNERPVEDNTVHVQLVTAGGVPLSETFCDRDGYVTFHAVPPGNYHLKLDGPNIKDTSTDTFQIGFQERMHMEWVHVAPKEDAKNANVPGAAPMVSASELRVPPKARNELDKGLEAFAKGDLKKAEEKLRKAIEIYPQYANAYNNLGVVLMRDKDRAGAIESWQKAIEVDSKYGPPYLNMARVSMQDNKMPEAAGYINKVLEFDPNNPEALALLAKTELMTRQYDKALAHARKALAVPHQHLADLHLIAGEALLRQNQNAEAVKEYEAYLKEDPDSPNAAQVRQAMAQIQAKKN